MIFRSHPTAEDAKTIHIAITHRELLVHYSYDRAGQLADSPLTEVSSPAGYVLRRFGYDKQARMVMHQLPTGLACHYEWTTLLGPHFAQQGLESRVSRYWSDAGDEIKFDYAYEPAQNLGGTRTTDNLGRVAIRHWNDQYQITKYITYLRGNDKTAPDKTVSQTWMTCSP